MWSLCGALKTFKGPRKRGNIVPQNVSLGRKRLGNNVSLPGYPRYISLETNVCGFSILEIQPTRPQNLVNIVSSARKRGNICCGNKMCLKKSETYFDSRKQKMFPEQMFRSRDNGETFTKTYFLNNASSFAGAFGR